MDKDEKKQIITQELTALLGTLLSKQEKLDTGYSPMTENIDCYVSVENIKQTIQDTISKYEGNRE